MLTLGVSWCNKDGGERERREKRRQADTVPDTVVCKQLHQLSVNSIIQQLHVDNTASKITMNIYNRIFNIVEASVFHYTHTLEYGLEVYLTCVLQTSFTKYCIVQLTNQLSSSSPHKLQLGSSSLHKRCVRSGQPRAVPSSHQCWCAQEVHHTPQTVSGGAYSGHV